MAIHYIVNDATRPERVGRKIIAHVCNDVGTWGGGFTGALSRRWSEPETAYLRWHANGHDPKAGTFGLGATQFAQIFAPVPRDYFSIDVANMIAQRGFPTRERPCALDFDALEHCLRALGEEAARIGATVHMPRIGCGIAGGQWSDVAPVIDRILGGVDVTVYDLPSR